MLKVLGTIAMVFLGIAGAGMWKGSGVGFTIGAAGIAVLIAIYITYQWMKHQQAEAGEVFKHHQVQLVGVCLRFFQAYIQKSLPDQLMEIKASRGVVCWRIGESDGIYPFLEIEIDTDVKVDKPLRMVGSIPPQSLIGEGSEDAAVALGLFVKQMSGKISLVTRR
jgi:hypothetical protein